MNHKPRVVAIILLMFIITQFIGLGVINYYSNQDNLLPYGMGFTPEMGSSGQGLGIIMIAFVIAITIFVLLTNIKAEFFIRMWFFFDYPKPDFLIELYCRAILVYNQIDSGSFNNFKSIFQH